MNWIALVFYLLCIGQVVAGLISYRAMITYYMFASTMLYFSLPAVGNIDPARACGLIVIFMTFMKYPHLLKRISNNPFMGYAVYVIVVSILMSFTWPIENFYGSPIHREFRIYVQLCTWFIVIMLAFIISWIYIEAENFRFFVNGCKIIALLHCLYGIYQYFADKYGLPVNGIIRNNLIRMGEEEYAVFNIDGERFFRINSFAGEPKYYAAILVFFAALILSSHLNKTRKIGWFSGVIFILMTLCCFLSYSTTAFISAVALVALYFWCKDISEFRIIFLLAILLGVFYFIWGASMDEILDERLFNRLEAEQDEPVEATIDFLFRNPHFAITGVGAGGISFYLADMIGGEARMISHTPNVGIVYLLAESGLIGLSLLLLPHFSTFGKLFYKRISDPHFRSIAFLAFFGVILLAVRESTGSTAFIYGSLVALGYLELNPQNKDY